MLSLESALAVVGSRAGSVPADARSSSISSQSAPDCTAEQARPGDEALPGRRASVQELLEASVEQILSAASNARITDLAPDPEPAGIEPSASVQQLLETTNELLYATANDELSHLLSMTGAADETFEEVAEGLPELPSHPHSIQDAPEAVSIASQPSASVQQLLEATDHLLKASSVKDELEQLLDMTETVRRAETHDDEGEKIYFPEDLEHEILAAIPGLDLEALQPDAVFPSNEGVLCAQRLLCLSPYSGMFFASHWCNVEATYGHACSALVRLHECNDNALAVEWQCSCWTPGLHGKASLSLCRCCR